jgi:DNA-binding transcriptional LysR family regulator
MLHEIDLSRADLNLLVLFEAVLREQHVGRAAEHLHLSPSAISHGLGRLRRLLGDPLFLRTPRGVVPTARALDLAEPIADVLARARSVIATAEPFDPKTSTRRFTIGGPDGGLAWLVPPLLSALREEAPSIDLGIRQVLPQAGRILETSWHPVLEQIEARLMDIAVLPIREVPARFASRVLYDETFVVAMRSGHPFKRKPTLDRYCEAQHLVVSERGDPHGFVDEALAALGRKRRVALTVPNFMQALSVLAETDLIAALPRSLVRVQSGRFGLVHVEPPLRLPDFQLRAVLPKVALMDGGLAWLFERLGRLL